MQTVTLVLLRFGSLARPWDFSSLSLLVLLNTAVLGALPGSGKWGPFFKKILLVNHHEVQLDLQTFVLAFQSYNGWVPIPPSVPIFHHQWSQHPSHHPNPSSVAGHSLLLSLPFWVLCFAIEALSGHCVRSIVYIRFVSPNLNWFSKYPFLSVSFFIWAAFSPSTWGRLPSS